MTDNIAIKVENLSKVYKLYDKPIDRLKESLNIFKKKYHKEFFALENELLLDLLPEVKKCFIGLTGAEQVLELTNMSLMNQLDPEFKVYYEWDIRRGRLNNEK